MLVGVFRDADVVAEGLGHLVDAIEALEQRHRHHDLRLLAVGLLQRAPDQQVELLVGAAELHVRLHRHRVVALRERVEELVDGDRLAGLVALGEVIALEHARHRVVRGQLHDLGGGEAAQPARVEVDARAGAVEDLEHLRLVGARVRLDLLGRQRRARGVAPRGVADHPGEVPDEERDVVPELLELAHLVEQHRVPEVQVGGGRVEARLHVQRRAAPELPGEVGVGEHLARAPVQLRDLFVQVHLIPVKSVLKAPAYGR